MAVRFQMPHERLHAYEIAVEFAIFADGLAAKLAKRPDLADQLRRASASVVLNTAEGAGEFSVREKVRFYRMAKRSATECAAVCKIALGLGIFESDEYAEAHALCGRIVGTLTTLIRSVETRAPSPRAP